MPEPQSINNAGAAAGYCFNGPFFPNPKFYTDTVGFVYNDGVLIQLPLLPGWPAAFAFGLNDNNQVYGEATRADSYGTISKTAVIWDHSSVVNVGTILPNSISFGAGINNRGEVVANSVSNDTGLQAAFYWRNGVQTPLPVPNGAIQSAAHWINDVGQIAGAIQYSVSPTGGVDEIHAFLWTVAGGMFTMRDLGLLPGGDYSLANFVNNRSQIVGSGTDANEVFRGVYSGGGSLHGLPYLPGGTFSSAISLNENGQILGEGDRSDGNIVPIVWQKSGIFDLDDLLPSGTPLLFGGGGGINDRGEITSTLVNADGTYSAVLLKPLHPNAN